MRLAAGSKLGRYTLQHLLGRGGLAAVYQAVNDQDQTLHAIKLLRISGAELSQRLLREGQLQARLQHPNIVPVTDTIEAYGSPGLVMALVRGPSLRGLLAQHSLSLPQLDALAGGVLAGMAFAHAHGVIHRDLKPANILIDLSARAPIPRIADFGLARLLEDEDALTRTGLALGTPGYMAPEQIRSARRADARSDVFSLGAILYTMAAGHPPFLGGELDVLLAATEGGRYPPLDAERLGPRAAIIAAALSADPSGRYRDAGAMAEAWAAIPSQPPRWPVLDHLLPAGSAPLPETLPLTVGSAPPSDAWEEERVLVVLGGGPVELGAVRAAIARRGGQEVGVGAGVAAMLHSASQARALARDCLDGLPGVGVVAHQGRISLRQVPSAEIARGARALEISGAAVSLLTALARLAVPGQLLQTAAVTSRDGLGLLGHWRLEGLEEPVALYGHIAGPLPADTERDWRVLSEAGAWRPVAAVPHNLPRIPGQFIGRAADLAALRAADSPVLLLGTGGVGKTRLAQRWARQELGRFPGGAFFCDLSAASTRDEVLQSIAQVLRPTGEEDGLSERILQSIIGRRRCLLILDNVEQVAEAVAGLLAAWAGRAEQATFLLTSRVRLPGATVVPVMPLPAGEAAGLFIARARQLRPQLQIGPAEDADIASICEILGGLPLAVELAAARVGVLSIARIRQRLSDRFRLLQSRHSLTPRQSTLRTTIDWSWQLLEPWEKAALAQCSAFSGAFRIEDAEGVLDLSAWPEAPWAMDVVQGLLDRCLLRPGPHTSDEPSVQMYASVEEYAAEKLRSPGAFAGSGPAAEAATWRRHGAHFAALGSPAALALLNGADGLSQRQHLSEALGNLLAAARRASRRQDAAIALPCSLAASEALIRSGAGAQAAALTGGVADLPGLSRDERAALLRRTSEAWLSLRRLDDAEPSLEEAITLAPAGSRSEGLTRLLRAKLAVHQSRMAAARADYEAVRQLNVTLQDPVLENEVHAGLGWLAYREGEPELAIRHYEVALRLSRARGDEVAAADALTGLGRLDQLQGRTEQAAERFSQALQVREALQDVFEEGMLSSQLAFLWRVRGDLTRATAHIQHALQLARSHGDRAREGIFGTTYGAILGDAGRNEEALVVLEEALSIHRGVGNIRDQARTLSLIGARHTNMDQLAAALESYRQARPLLQQLNDRWGEGQNLGAMARAYRRIGDLTSAEQHYLETLAITRELKYRRHEGLTLNNLGNLLLDLGRLDEARRHFEDARIIQKNEGVRRLEALPISGLAMAAEVVGDLDTAEARYAEARQIAEEVGNRLYIGWLRSCLGWIAHRQGRLLAAREHYEAAAVLLEASHAPGYAAVLESRRALLLARRGQLAEARAAAAAARERIAGLRVPAERLEVICNQIAILQEEGLPSADLRAEAEALYTRIGLSPRSLLGQRLAAL